MLRRLDCSIDMVIYEFCKLFLLDKSFSSYWSMMHREGPFGTQYLLKYCGSDVPMRQAMQYGFPRKSHVEPGEQYVHIQPPSTRYHGLFSPPRCIYLSGRRSRHSRDIMALQRPRLKGRLVPGPFTFIGYSGCTICFCRHAHSSCGRA